MCKTNVKMDLYYANIYKYEHEKTWQGYSVRFCLRLVLNKLKEMKGPTSIFTPLGIYLKKVFEVFMCPSSKKAS
jgi:hypothetical protein